MKELNSSYGIGVVHPGRILQNELSERSIKHKDFAIAIGMEPSHLSALIHGNRNITPAIANRLEHALGISASVWMNLQSRYALNKANNIHLSTAGLVDGYSPRIREAAVLREDTPLNESVESLTLEVPKNDLSLAKELFIRFGWSIKEEA